jgi:8-oxo-dGTP pyrophosphatase MutT (NUDIX family)
MEVTDRHRNWWRNRFVVGFAFIKVNPNDGFFMRAAVDEVVLMIKKRPAWQSGQLNGVGGHCEAKDHMGPRQTMSREFEEETGAMVRMWEWHWSEVIEFDDCILDVFFCQLQPEIKVLTKTDEEVIVLPIKSVLAQAPHPLLNIQAKIIFALDRLKQLGPPCMDRPRVTVQDYQI